MPTDPDDAARHRLTPPPPNGRASADHRPDVSRLYEERTREFRQRFRDVSRTWNRVANLRLAAFAAGVGLIGWGLWRGLPILIVPGLGALLLFAWLVGYHRRLGRQRRRLGLLIEINRAAIARVERDWANLPSEDDWLPPVEHPFARDLDLFGQASLFHFLARTTTPMGTLALREWLLDPAPPRQIGRRQETVADLAPRLDLRQEMEVLGRGVATHPNLEPFLGWAEGPRWLTGRQALVRGARGSVALLWLLLVADLTGLLGPPLWLIPAAINLLVAQTIGAPIYPILAKVASQQRAMLRYAEMLSLIRATPLQTPMGESARAALSADNQDAPASLRRLDRLAALLIPRGTLLYIPIQAMTLWDVHLLDALERWQAAAGAHARTWLTVLGKFEALASLAGLAHDEPAWVFPTVKTGAPSLTATALAHPLLPATGVANDVTVGPRGSFLLVTGSNMSGKSTLLRAIGTNAVLAGAGAPVRAAALTMPPVALGTSARVQDSLTEGVSFFMAELQRLKQIVDLANATKDEGGQFLYLLDEILQGTNTAERQIAARRIVRHLLAAGAIGAISTHDLSLAETPALTAAARPIHFRERFDESAAGAAMSFDYLARAGIATSSNALRLMELIGLASDEIDAEEEDHPRPAGRSSSP